MPRLRSFVRLCALFMLIAGALIPLSWLPSPWITWRPATCLPDDCFCEASGTGFIRQPIDTWSNLAFVLVGLLILRDVQHLERSNVHVAKSKDAALISRRPAYRVIYALAVVLIGLGSWFYHASLTFIGQWFDVMGMYLLGTFMVLYNVARLRPLSNRTFAVGYVLFNLALAISLIVIPELRRYLFGGLLVVTIWLEVLLRQRRRNRVSPSDRELANESRNPVSGRVRYFIAALLIYILAQFIWTLDLSHIVCDPNSLLQGHAIWHILTAISAGLLYFYYRSVVAFDG